MKKLILFVMCFLVCAFLVGANPQMANWGGAGYTFGIDQLPRTLWGSQTSDGTLPTAQVNQSLSLKYLPIVINPNDPANILSTNYVFLMDANNIYVYDNNFNQLSSINIPGMQGSPTLVRYPFANPPLKFAVLAKSGANYSVQILNFSGVSLVVDKNIAIGTKDYTGSIKGGLFNALYLPDRSMNITLVQPASGVNFVLTNAWRANLTYCANLSAPFYSSDIEVNDYDGDGYDDIIAIAKDQSTGNFAVGKYSVRNGVWDWGTDKISGAATTCSIMSGQVGSGSNYNFIAYVKDGTTRKDYVLDQSGNFRLNVSSTNTNGYFSYPSIADINKDGGNEILIPDDAQGDMRVYNNAYGLATTIKLIRLSGSPARTGAQIYGVGKFVSNSTWLDFAGVQGIIRVNNTHTGADIVYTYTGTSASSVGAIVVDINTKVTKDELYLDEVNPTMAFFSSLPASVCGDGLCGYGETMLSCPADCQPANPTDAIITSVSINPCNTVTILKNQTVQVKVIAATNDSKAVTITADYCANCLTSCEQTASQANVASNSQATFNFIANCTGTSENLIIGASTTNQKKPTSITFPFTISDTSGALYNDNSCGLTQPLNQETPLNITGSGTNNQMYNGIAGLTAITGLSGIIIWLIGMFLVAIVIFIVGAMSHVPNLMTIGLTFFVEVLAVIIGSYLHVLPVSFVIVIALSLVIVIGLWLRGQATGTGGQ